MLHSFTWPGVGGGCAAVSHTGTFLPQVYTEAMHVAGALLLVHLIEAWMEKECQIESK